MESTTDHIYHTLITSYSMLRQ